MCCFSGTVQRVSDTSIFARSEGDRQLLAYQARVAAAEPLAMVLPLPAAGPVTFVDLSGVPDLFERLGAAFPAPRVRSHGKSGPPPSRSLAVVQVGRWVASHVPDRERFVDLDPRFRLSEDVLGALGDGYAGWGFAVFQLGPGDQRLHPMGVDFVRRDATRLFFPTVHVHDGTVPRHANFDHTLYAQQARGERLRLDEAWEESRRDLGFDAGRFLRADRHVVRRQLVGGHPNVDAWL
jgi:hypothetical protein